MIKKIDLQIDRLKVMKKYPKEIFYIGDISLLDQTHNIVSIIGSRKPITYTKTMTQKLAKAFSDIGVIIVSGFNL